MDLADIVNQSEQPPLYIHFQFGTYSEAVHALVHTDVGKDRLDKAQPSGIDLLSLFGIDLCLHLVDQVGLRIHRDGKIPARCGCLAQTARLQGAGGAVFFAGMVDIIGSMAIGLVAGMTGELFALGTAIHLLARIEREVSRREEPWLDVGSLPAVDAILETLLLGKTWIAFAELDVGDVGIDLFLPAYRQAVERMVVAVGSELLALKIGFIFSDGDDVFFALTNIGSMFSWSWLANASAARITWCLESTRAWAL